MLYEHYNNSNFHDVLEYANYVLPDGVPILKAFRHFCGVDQPRIAGNDVIYSLLHKANVENLKVSLIGSTEDVLEKISKKLSTKHISHMVYSPPFSTIEKFEFDYQAQLINKFKPDLILVGLGCPKQEIWMNRMMNMVNAPMYGLGGAFLLYAGIDTRAPKWMRDLGLEWLYRLSLEPKRLLKRYIITNSFFIWLVFKEIIKKSKVTHS